MKIAIPLYDRFTALDAVGPYEVLSRLPGAERHLAGSRAGRRCAPTPAARHRGRRRVRGPAGPRDPDGARRHRHATRSWTTSAWSAGSGAPTRPRSGPPRCAPARCCSAPPGVLDGLEATSHWLDIRTLERFGARPTGQRVVEQGKVITAAGVSSGIDMGLVLAARIAGPEVAQAIQLGHRVRPAAALRRRLVEKAPPEIVELVRGVAAARRASMPVDELACIRRTRSPSPPLAPCCRSPRRRRPRPRPALEGVRRRRRAQLRHHLRDADQRQPAPAAAPGRSVVRAFHACRPGKSGKCRARAGLLVQREAASTSCTAVLRLEVTCRKGSQDGQAHLHAVHLVRRSRAATASSTASAASPAPAPFRWMPSASRTIRRRPSTSIASR